MAAKIIFTSLLIALQAVTVPAMAGQPGNTGPVSWKASFSNGTGNITDTREVPSTLSGLKGKALRKKIKAQWYEGKHREISYNRARKLMYSYIDKKDDGKVYCVYTGFSMQSNNTANMEPINAEHTIPQSWFKKKHPMKSDLHHLFPTHKIVNAERGNFPFNEIPDQETNAWYGALGNKFEKSSGIPANEIDTYSELLKKSAFEPKENHKGDLARAVFYFYTMYPTQAGDITKIISSRDLKVLLQWHKQDPPDAWEKERNNRVAEKQGNRNPYIDQPELVEKGWF